ncbi:hypothetical protein F4779DRAFT_561824 [Xylariaceae sp. FL0662B]|nr:hypothetical protein F4779DRAFT_561824 [Xylariaceae sp. FL0662B]
MLGFKPTVLYVAPAVAAMALGTLKFTIQGRWPEASRSSRRQRNLNRVAMFYHYILSGKDLGIKHPTPPGSLRWRVGTRICRGADGNPCRFPRGSASETTAVVAHEGTVEQLGQYIHS